MRQILVQVKMSGEAKKLQVRTFRHFSLNLDLSWFSLNTLLLFQRLRPLVLLQLKWVLRKLISSIFAPTSSNLSHNPQWSLTLRQILFTSNFVTILARAGSSRHLVGVFWRFCFVFSQKCIFVGKVILTRLIILGVSDRDLVSKRLQRRQNLFVIWENEFWISAPVWPLFRSKFLFVESNHKFAFLIIVDKALQSGCSVCKLIHFCACHLHNLRLGRRYLHIRWNVESWGKHSWFSLRRGIFTLAWLRLFMFLWTHIQIIFLLLLFVLGDTYLLWSTV